MDVVYISKPGDNNKELRYSLRSLSNWPHGKVWCAGFRPSWSANVGHIPTRQIPGEKHPNSIKNQRAACLDPRVSDPFVLFNDDFFVMKPFEEPVQYTWGLVDDVIAKKTARDLGNKFLNSMIETRKILAELGFENPVSYQLHTPLIVHKQAWLEAMDFNREGVWVQHATIYGNQIGLGGHALDEDVKVCRPELPVLPWVKDSDLLSTDDATFVAGQVGRYIRKQFPQKSRYER